MRSWNKNRDSSYWSKLYQTTVRSDSTSKWFMNRSGGVKSNKVILFKIKCTLYTVGMGFYVRNTVFSLICLIKVGWLTTETQLQAFNNPVVHEAFAFYNNILAGTRSTEQQIHGICTRIVVIPIGIITHLVWSFVLRVEVSTVNITSNISKTKRKKRRRKETISLNIMGKYVPMMITPTWTPHTCVFYVHWQDWIWFVQLCRMIHCLQCLHFTNKHICHCI